ncbi:MAG: DUF3413 domain-containing protein [Bacteroidaceae bacterium]|nr:DUF3413 domain-containing protein [Bacteroidaceae bacterium]
MHIDFRRYFGYVGRNLRAGFAYFVLLTAMLTLLFVWYLLGSQVLEVMDFMGWVFYLTSCISHAACFALIPYLLYTLFIIIGVPRLARTLMSILATVLLIVGYINEQVYQIYRFHINGFVLNMVTGPSARQIFTFDWKLYLTYGLYTLLALALSIGAWWLVDKAMKQKRLKGKRIGTLVGILVGSTLFAHIYHIFASFYEKQSVIVSERLLPYYFPTTSYGLLTEQLHLTPPRHEAVDFGLNGGDMVYPLHPLDGDTARYNVLIILLDSWNSRALTASCMPNVYRYAQQNHWYRNHLSGSNGTRSGVFSLFFAISSYYWNIAESNHITPVIFDVARREGYTFRNYPGASQLDPPFGRVLFAKEKDVRIETPGNTVYDRDEQITKDFIADIRSQQRRGEPFFSFLFYDLPHSFEPSPHHAMPFQPAWQYADYSKLNNQLDPTPFWNLYRNTCYQADELIGQIFTALRETGLDQNTMVVITGDHAQEFNENQKNYWGHNSNFSRHQIMVPLIVHTPANTPLQFSHRTTHYDIVPTIMHTAMGVTNPPSDYSLGHLLTDTASRQWHVVGSELNYAFIIGGDTILEKSAEGGLQIYDAKMNRVTDYHINVAEFNQATQQLNRFMK